MIILRDTAVSQQMILYLYLKVVPGQGIVQETDNKDIIIVQGTNIQLRNLLNYMSAEFQKIWINGS